MNNSNEVNVRSGAPIAGTYYIDSMYDAECVAVTAQGLLDLGTWIAANKTQLEAEALEAKRAVREFWQREQSYFPPKGSWQDEEERQR